MHEESIHISPEEFAEEYMREDPHRMMVVHISKKEIEALDMLQNGESIDPHTGLHEYEALAPIFDDPEVRKLAVESFHQSSSPEGEDPELKHYYSLGKAREKSFKNAPGDKEEVTEEVAQDGKYGDNALALLPVNVMHTFGEMRGFMSINPDGLFEFNMWKKILRGGAKVIQAPVKLISKGLQAVGVRKNHANEFLRAVGTIGGYLYGGPIGAGIGNAYASYGTGKTFKNSAISGFKNWALAKGVDAIPSIASHASGAASSLATGNVAGAANGIGQGISSGVQGVGNTVSNMVNSIPGVGSLTGGTGAAGAGAAAKGAAAASSGGFGNMLGIAALGVPALNYLSTRQADKNNRRAQERQEEADERAAQRAGLREKWVEPQSEEYVDNPRIKNRTPREIERGIFMGPARIPKRLRDKWESQELPMVNFSKGGSVNGRTDVRQAMTKSGLISGPGKGQADKIRTQIPHGAYVLDATSVADQGDGSSTAGGKAYDEFFDKQRRKAGGSVGSTRKHIPVDVFLSDKEYVVDPQDVELIGEGSNDKGAYLLKGMVKALRKHKNSNGDRLPPKAKSIESYIRASGRK